MPKIDRLYAFVACNKDENDEGIMAFFIPTASPYGMWMPMVGADIDRVKSLKPIADDISKQSGKSYKIYLFENRKEYDKCLP